MTRFLELCQGLAEPTLACAVAYVVLSLVTLVALAAGLAGSVNVYRRLQISVHRSHVGALSLAALLALVAGLAGLNLLMR